MRFVLRSRSARVAAVSAFIVAACGAGGERSADRFGTDEAPLCLTACAGGQSCCTGSAYATIPADHQYFLTSFGGGADTQGMSCGGTADGTWWYAADKQRFGCGAIIQITNPANGACGYAKVQDYGPGTCVEDAACKPIIDASPLVAQHLFGVSSAGWSDRLLVVAEVAPAGTPLGPCPVVPSPDAGPALDAGIVPVDAGPIASDAGSSTPDAGTPIASDAGETDSGAAAPPPTASDSKGGCGCGAGGLSPLFAFVTFLWRPSRSRQSSRR